MYKQKGFTMISLIVVIIIIIILAAASVFSSKDLLREAKVAKVYNEMFTVRNAIQELKSLNETDPEAYDMNKMLMGEKIENIEDYNQRVGWNLKEGKEYYKGQTLNELKLRDIQRNEYYQRFTGMKRDDPKHYDMVVNVLKTGVDGAVKMILDYVEQKESGSK